VVVVNKVDLASKAQILAALTEAGAWGLAAYVPVSALRGEGLAPVVAELEPLMPVGPFFFPPDMHSDQPEELLAAEILREKYLARLREELPHSLAVVVNEIETRDDGLVHVSATVFVERTSQKGIVIGKGGELLRTVGTEARHELEVLFGAKVFLDVRVKVEQDWQHREATLDRLGF
jgi:GTP-binding protein Era